MKRLLLLLTLFLGAAGVTLVSSDADARRLGGGGNAGMKRSLPTQQKPATPPPSSRRSPPTPIRRSPPMPSRPPVPRRPRRPRRAAPGSARSRAWRPVSAWPPWPATSASARNCQLHAAGAARDRRLRRHPLRDGALRARRSRRACAMPAACRPSRTGPSGARTTPMGGGGAPRRRRVTAPVVVEPGAPALPPGFDTPPSRKRPS